MPLHSSLVLIEGGVEHRSGTGIPISLFMEPILNLPLFLFLKMKYKFGVNFFSIFHFAFLVFFFVVLGFELKALCFPGLWSTT
jgi:hypothetical protein